MQRPRHTANRTFAVCRAVGTRQTLSGRHPRFGAAPRAWPHAPARCCARPHPPLPAGQQPATPVLRPGRAAASAICRGPNWGTRQRSPPMPWAGSGHTAKGLSLPWVGSGGTRQKGQPPLSRFWPPVPTPRALTAFWLTRALLAGARRHPSAPSPPSPPPTLRRLPCHRLPAVAPSPPPCLRAGPGGPGRRVCHTGVPAHHAPARPARRGPPPRLFSAPGRPQSTRPPGRPTAPATPTPARVPGAVHPASAPLPWVS